MRNFRNAAEAFAHSAVCALYGAPPCEDNECDSTETRWFPERRQDLCEDHAEGRGERWARGERLNR